MPFFIYRTDSKVAAGITDHLLRNWEISGQDIRNIEELAEVSPFARMSGSAAKSVADAYSDGVIDEKEYFRIISRFRPGLAADAVDKARSNDGTIDKQKFKRITADSDHLASTLRLLGDRAYQMDRLRRQVPHLVTDLLMNANKETRAAAAQRLEVIGWEMGSEEALPSLRKVIDDEIVPALAAALEKDSDVAVQKAAASALRIMPRDKVKEHAVPGLKRAIQSGDSDLRCKAIYVFGKIGSRDHIPLLLEYIDDDDAHVREAVVFALGEIGPPVWYPNVVFQHAPYLYSVCTTEASWHSLVLGFCADEVTAALADVVKDDPNPLVRLEAAHALGEMRSEWAVAPLAYAMLNDRSEGVRDTAAEELGDLDTHKSIRVLLDTLRNDKRPDRRQAAVRGLGRSTLREAEMKLIGILQNDPDPAVRSSAAHVLGNNEAYAAVAALTYVRDNDPNENVRTAASRALEFID